MGNMNQLHLLESNFKETSHLVDCEFFPIECPKLGYTFSIAKNRSHSHYFRVHLVSETMISLKSHIFSKRVSSMSSVCDKQKSQTTGEKTK